MFDYSRCSEQWRSLHYDIFEFKIKHQGAFQEKPHGDFAVCHCTSNLCIIRNGGGL